jgi:putative YphP/YqiW family bacilliredoxin
MDGLPTNYLDDMATQLQAMREELSAVGVQELRTPEDVDAVMTEMSGTILLVVNSVCGCAAGNARPGVGMALQNKIIPDAMFTVFAGQDCEATQQARQFIVDQPPSSPSVALFKDGRLVYMMHRHLIEGRNASQVAVDLVEQFELHCATKGPSVSADKFAQMPYARICGSQFSAPE